MKNTRLISFDLDNTLVDPGYVTYIWEIAIPELYAKRHDVKLSVAKKRVISEYERVGDASLEWYDIGYWFGFFKLPESWKGVLEKHKHMIRTFPEVKGVIEELSQRFDLIITSNAAREFVDIEIKESGIKDYFIKTFSATSDFKQIKKTPGFYKKICETMNVDPLNVIHIGDHIEFDYVAPKKLGIKAYYLDRNSEEPKGVSTVKNFSDFSAQLKKERLL
jgi:5'-nucleotidase